jgi:serine/threonine protein kinase
LEILECLGRGGMGVVYKARQKALGRIVALKILAPERSTDPGFAGRFTAEARMLASLNHPNIVTIHDFGESGGFYHLVMEYVDGVNLRQAMTAGRFTPEQALAIVPPVCEALQYAHDHGVVHRDIKPENLLLDQQGRVKVADFGIAKLLGSATAGGPDAAAADSAPAAAPPAGAGPGGPDTLGASAAGTPQYMAPEQRARGAVDHRADIYSLGVVLYELLTGTLPGHSLKDASRRRWCCEPWPWHQSCASRPPPSSAPASRRLPPRPRQPQSKRRRRNRRRSHPHTGRCSWSGSS